MGIHLLGMTRELARVISWLGLFLAISSGVAVADSGNLAPLNPAFVDFQAALADQANQGAAGNAVAAGAGEHATGYIPAPFDMSHMKGKVAEGDVPQLVLPAAFDLRSSGKVTSVRDQGACGACWTFGTLSSLESNMLVASAGTYDFSENHLNVRHGFDWAACAGGNSWLSTAYLTRWGSSYAAGPVYESDDPYTSTTATSVAGLSPRFHAQEVLFLPDRANGTDNTTWKNALYQHGVLYVSYYTDGQGSTSTYWNNTTKAYYYNGSPTSNHAVSIVGWDDSYAASNFSTTPPGNGAYIVKNSWGTGWGASGYFYISYYDTGLNEATVFRSPSATSNYGRQYMHDPLGMTTSYGYGVETAWGANIFTAAATENLSAVGFYTPAVNTGYQVYVYTNVGSGPTAGTLQSAATVSGTAAYAGYHTVPLGALVPVTSGQKFSVVVRFITPGYTYPVPVEYPFSNYSSGAVASAGQSYISSDGASWSDMSYNVNIRAYAAAGGSAPGAPTISAMGAGNGRVIIYFSPPASSGGSTITGYTASCAPAGGGAAITASGSGSPITVTGLSNGTSYTCGVTATNSYGTGSASAGSTRTPGGVQRTFVSAQGADANVNYNCDATHPCRMFTAGVSLLKTNGEVVVLDSGNYGAVTITDSLAITAPAGVYAGISAFSGANGVTISGAGINVVLKGVTINGMGGLAGVQMTSGASLTMDGCVVGNFPEPGRGINIATPAKVRIVNSAVRDSYLGIAAANGATVTISDTKILNGSRSRTWGVINFGSSNNAGTVIDINDSLVSGGHVCIHNEPAAGYKSYTRMTRTTAIDCNYGIVNNTDASPSASVHTVSSSVITGNVYGLYNYGIGVIKSLGNNHVLNNGTDVSGTVTSQSLR